MASESITERLVFSYLELRRVIGVLGTLLPIVLLLGGWVLFDTGIRGSISSYYHTGMGDVLVGTLCVIGFFLLSYRGYPSDDGSYLRSDKAAGDLAFVFALGVALFPTSANGEITAISIIHLVSTALLLLTLAYFSLFLFTKMDPQPAPTQKKRQRNLVYRACGAVIVACLLLIAANAGLENLTESPLTDLQPVFWLESFAIIAFGVSWLVKGESIPVLND